MTLDDYHFTDMFREAHTFRYKSSKREIILILKEEYEFYLNKIRILDTREDWYGDGLIDLKHTITIKDQFKQNFNTYKNSPDPKNLKNLIFFKKSKTDNSFDLEIDDDDVFAQFMLEFR